MFKAVLAILSIVFFVWLLFSESDTFESQQQKDLKTYEEIKKARDKLWAYNEKEYEFHICCSQKYFADRLRYSNSFIPLSKVDDSLPKYDKSIGYYFKYPVFINSIKGQDITLAVWKKEEQDEL